VAVYFNGKFLVEPQAASKIDDTALESPGIVGLLAVAVLGEGTGGQPTEPLLFATPADAREVLRSGALLQGVLNAFSPSAEVPGASFVYAVRVNPATQAALTLDNGVATDLIDLTSVDYGLYTNNIQIQIEAGTNIGKKISTRLSDVVLVEDDVGENMFSIIYTGAGTPAVIDVDATTLTTTITGGPGSEDLNITLADYDNFEDLANYINTFAGGVYTFTVLASNPQQAPVLMDYVAAQNILVAYTHTQHLQAAVDYFNSAGNPFVTAVRKAAVGAQLGNISYTPLAGAIEGVTTNTSWQDALDALNDVRVRALTPMSGDAAIHTMGDTHCQQQSLPGGTSPRRQIVGGTAGETVAQVKTRAANLNSDRTAIVYPDIDDLDLDGTLQEDWDPFYFAAKVCGATLGAGIGEPLTRKTFRLQGLSAKLTAAEKADLLLNGVMPVEFRQGSGYIVVQSITTWLQSNNFYRVELSTGMAADETALRTQDRLDTLIGRKNSPVTLAQAVSAVESELQLLEKEEVIVGDEASGSPAYQNIQGRVDGDTIYVSYEASPAVPLNYVLQTVHAVPFSGTLTA
jgi:hypothetical protein